MSKRVFHILHFSLSVLVAFVAIFEISVLLAMVSGATAVFAGAAVRSIIFG